MKTLMISKCCLRYPRFWLEPGQLSQYSDQTSHLGHFTPKERTSIIHWTGGQMDPWAGLDTIV